MHFKRNTFLGHQRLHCHIHCLHCGGSHSQISSLQWQGKKRVPFSVVELKGNAKGNMASQDASLIARLHYRESGIPARAYGPSHLCCCKNPLSWSHSTHVQGNVQPACQQQSNGPSSHLSCSSFNQGVQNEAPCLSVSHQLSKVILKPLKARIYMPSRISRIEQARSPKKRSHRRAWAGTQDAAASAAWTRTFSSKQRTRHSQKCIAVPAQNKHA